MTKEKSLIEFLREYMLLGEIAYIEQNAPVSNFYSRADWSLIIPRIEFP